MKGPDYTDLTSHNNAFWLALIIGRAIVGALQVLPSLGDRKSPLKMY